MHLNKAYYDITNQEVMGPANTDNEYDNRIYWEINAKVEHHMCNNILDIEKAELRDTALVATNSHEYKIDILGEASGYLNWKSGKQTGRALIAGVLIVPELETNVISSQILVKRGFSIEYEESRCLISLRGKIVAIATWVEDQYYLITEKKMATTGEEDTIHGKTAEAENHTGITWKEREYNCITHEPDTWREINMLGEEEKALWNKAMREEMITLEKNNVITPISDQPEKKPIGSRWTYAVKRNENDKIVKVRARLVAKGFSQKWGTDYNETYAPVVRHSTIRGLLTIAAKRKMMTRHCDISSAFLYGKLDETIFMKGPEGPGPESKMVFRLNKAIYGLKQAAKSWNTRIDFTLTQAGMIKGEGDTCLYKKNQNDNHIYVLIHVDDLLMVSNSANLIQELISNLEKEYQIKDLGRARCYLGIVIESDEEEPHILIHQTPKINRLTAEHNLEYAKGVTIPMTTDFAKGIPHSTSKLLADNRPYQQIVGSLLYLSLTTRPDIHLAANLLGRRVEKPTIADMEGAKRVVKYLYSTRDHKLLLGGEGEEKLISYSDADWGGDLSSRKSTSGQLHFIDNSLIEWHTKKQSSVALSTAEAEFISSAQAIQEILWLHRLMKDLDIVQDLPTILNTDNQSSMSLMESPRVSH